MVRKWTVFAVLPLLAVVATAMVAGSAGAGDWPAYGGGPQRTQVAEDGPGSMLTVRWRTPAGNAVQGAPVVRGGLVYVGADDGRFYAFDVRTGEMKWSFSAGARIRAGAAVDGAEVFIPSYNGILYALDAASGWPKWQYMTGGWIASSPLVSGDYLYFGSSDGYLYALDRYSGALRWRFPVGSDMVKSAPAAAGGLVYVEAYQGTVYAVDAVDGRKVWSFATGGSLESSPVAAGDTVFVAASGPKVGGLFALASTDGSVRWRFKARENNYWTGMAFTGDLVVAANSGRVYALSATTGEVKWVTDLPVQEDGFRPVLPLATPPVVGGGRVYLGTYFPVRNLPSEVVAINLDSGKIEGRTPLVARIASPLALAGGTLFLGDYDDHLQALGTIRVLVNGREVVFDDVSPYIRGGRTLAPFRPLLEALRANEISWDEATRTVRARRGNRMITLVIGRREAEVNGEIVTLEAPAELCLGRTVVPVRFVAEALGGTVRGWDRENLVVQLEVPEG